MSKVVSDLRLGEEIQRRLTLEWSSEQISRSLRLEFPNDAVMHVATETIYQCLYRHGSDLHAQAKRGCLRTGRRRRHRRKHPNQRRDRFSGTSIHDRPAEATDRSQPGHWEGDLIVGPSNRSAIATLVERTTRTVALVHLDGKHDAESVRKGVAVALAVFSPEFRRRLTWDQGSEMAERQLLTSTTGLPVYFADPHSPWQRGSNENMNGLRQYFPKGTDLAQHTPVQLQHVAERLNSRPRKTLDWSTPAERLATLLTSTE